MLYTYRIVWKIVYQQHQQDEWRLLQSPHSAHESPQGDKGQKHSNMSVMLDKMLCCGVSW